MSGSIEIDPDEREAHPAARARHRIATGVFLAVAIVGVAYFSWWTYETAKPPQLPNSIPVIHSDAAPVKEAPSNPGGMVVPDQDSALLNHEDRQGRLEQLLPPPETAMPRPAPPPPPLAATPAPETMAEAPKAAPSLATQNVAPPPPPVAPSPATTVAPPPVAPPPAAAPRPATGPGYRLQLGALRTEEAAKAEWQRLQKAQPALLGKLSLTITRADLGAKGVFYRVQAGPIADAAEAERSCAALKSQNIGCVLVKP